MKKSNFKKISHDVNLVSS